MFTSIGLAGHFYPLVPLAWAFRAAGHEVLVVTQEHFLATAVRSGLPVATSGPSGDLAGTTVRDGGFASLFGRSARRGLRGFRSIVDSWRPDLVVSERAEFAGRVAAAGAGLPYVELHWGIPALRKYESAALVELGLAGLPDPAAVLNPWPPSLRLPHAVGHLGLRNVVYNGDTVVPDWVWHPRERPRVCLTLGTVLPRLGEQFAATVQSVLEHLAALEVELVVAVDDAVATRLPALPAEVTHVGRMALSPVLAACDAVVHHGGQGTALTAFDAGCPQLILPDFDDQFDNAAAVVRAGAGLRLLPDEATPRAVAQHCADLLASPRFGVAANRVAGEIATLPSPAVVVDRLVQVAREAGPATAA